MVFTIYLKNPNYYKYVLNEAVMLTRFPLSRAIKKKKICSQVVRFAGLSRVL